MQTQLFPDGTVPDCATPDWYATRDRAPHVDDGTHRPRLLLAADLIRFAATMAPPIDGIVDLGAGDGGLLSLLADLPVPAWGYDLQPSNLDGAAQRGVDVMYADVTVDPIVWADLAVCTETLEHLVDPHGMVRRIAEHARFLVASSPYTETADSHYEHHTWAWDRDGYARLISDVGFTILRHETVDIFQVVLAVRDDL